MTLHRSILALAVLSTVACSKTPPPPPAVPVPAPAIAAPAPAVPDAAPAPAASPAAAGDALRVTPFERSLLDPLLDDLRQGVRPLDAQAFGLCSTTGKECTDFLGAAPGELAAGKYLVKAELAVPRLGDKGTWTVAFEVKCTTTSTSGSSTTTSTNAYNHTYEVSHSDKERGYRLMPLYAIESPSRNGSRRCAYTLTAPHPDGAKVYSGSWSVPQAQ
jgi:hypothetical protein